MLELLDRFITWVFRVILGPLADRISIAKIGTMSSNKDLNRIDEYIDCDIEDEYEISCPKCGHSPVRSRTCSAIGCEEGWIDRFDEDPMWYDENDPKICTDCWGTGLERWCPNCGANLQEPKMRKIIWADKFDNQSLNANAS